MSGARARLLGLAATSSLVVTQVMRLVLPGGWFGVTATGVVALVTGFAAGVLTARLDEKKRHREMMENLVWEDWESGDDELG